MAYNAVSGTLIAAQTYAPETYVVGNIVSGNLSTSDGASILNIPRVSTPASNGIVLNTGGDANTLRCDTNLIFDGTTLSLTGDLTASIAISASFFEGDGSRLTNLPGGGGGGTGAGIFTEVSATKAYTTSSIQIGSTSTPARPLSVAGASILSGALIHKRHTTASDYTITVSDYYVGADTTSTSIKLTLPVASLMGDGQTIVIKDESGNADSNNIIVSGSAADTIDGQNLIVLESPYAAVSLYCNGVSKYFVY